MKQTKRTLRVFPVLGLSFASLLILGWGRGHQPDTVVVSGTVLDPGSGQPLPGAEVSWRSQRVTTDRTGHYKVKLPVGIREISASAPRRPSVNKLLIVREAGSSLTQDVLLPDSTRTPRKVLILDRGARVEQHQKDLSSDLSADSPISLADEFGNHDQLLPLNSGKYRLYSPVWMNPAAIAFGKEALIHNPASASQLGVFEYQTGSAKIQQIAAGIGARFISKAPHKDALAVATSRELYVIDPISNGASLRQISKLEPDRGFILSVAWASDDRIYFTVDDAVPIDDRHYLTRSRIASIGADGTGLDSDWAAESDHSFRYPMSTNDGKILFCRFALDGKQQTLWSRNLATGKTTPLVESGLRAVYLDTAENRLYYIYRDNLHLHDLKSGADWIIVNSVEEADYLR